LNSLFYDRGNWFFVVDRIIHWYFTGKERSTQAAGNGGGAIINVLLITGLGYNAKDSISITYIFLMGGGLASTIASIRKRNN
jgi:hypothetical protein